MHACVHYSFYNPSCPCGSIKKSRTSNENYADNFLKLSVRYGHCSKKGSLFVSFQEGREMSVNYLRKKL